MIDANGEIFIWIPRTCAGSVNSSELTLHDGIGGSNNTRHAPPHRTGLQSAEADFRTA